MIHLFYKIKNLEPHVSWSPLREAYILRDTLETLPTTFSILSCKSLCVGPACRLDACKIFLISKYNSGIPFDSSSAAFDIFFIVCIWIYFYWNHSLFSKHCLAPHPRLNQIVPSIYSTIKFQSIQNKRLKWTNRWNYFV